MQNIDLIDDPEERKGILSKSPLLDLENFSFAEQVGLDYLHNFCLGTLFFVTGFINDGHKTI